MFTVMVAHITLVFSLLLCAGVAHAQTYRCNSGGATYLSDRPCGPTNPTQLGGYGPARSQPMPSYSAPLPGAPRAQEHLRYLSAGCASISEAIRTGPSRGVRTDVIQGLNEEYRQKCAFEDQEARAQAQQDKLQEQKTQIAQRDSAKSEREQSMRTSQQCAGMKDVVALKRKRESELNAKEIEALRELERSYNATCIAR